MQVTIHRSLSFAAPRGDVFEAVTALENLPAFVGYGPIPGIAEARHDGPIAQGSEIQVRNVDGSNHREQVEILDPPSCYRLRIFAFDSPFRFLVRHATEQLDFSDDGAGTLVAREFCFTLTSPLVLPLALPLIRVFFARALDRNYDELRKLIDTPRC